METIRVADINDKYDIEKLIKVMLGDENADEVAKSLVDGFFMNSESYMVYVIEVLNFVKGFCVIIGEHEESIIIIEHELSW